MRSAESIREAQSRGDFDSVQSETSGLPPGYLAGFGLSVDKKRLRIEPGIANISGRMVMNVQEQYQSSPELDEKFAPLTQYYVYITGGGSVWIDRFTPTFRINQFGRYHPALPHRYIGSVKTDVEGVPEVCVSDNPLNNDSVDSDKLVSSPKMVKKLFKDKDNIDALIEDAMFTNTLTANSAFITTLVARDLFTDSLTAKTAFITSLVAQDLFTDSLTAKTAFITSLVAQDLFTDSLTAKTAFVDSLTANTAFITRLTGDSAAITTAFIRNLTGETLDYRTGFIESLVNETAIVDTGFIKTLTANEVFAEQVSSTSAFIDNLFSREITIQPSGFIRSGETGSSTVYWSLDRTGGIIAGWNINDGSFSADNILISSVESKIVAGLITLDGAANSITFGDAGQIVATAGLESFTLGSSLAFDIPAGGDATMRIGAGASSFRLVTNEGLWLGDDLLATAPFSVTLDGYLSARSGKIGGFKILESQLTSRIVTGTIPSGKGLTLNHDLNRVSVFSSSDEVVAMGYISGLPKQNAADDGSYYGEEHRGFWVLDGDYLVIDGDVQYTNGDWLVVNDASFRIENALGATVIRLGTNSGSKGLFVNETHTGLNYRARLSSEEFFIGNDEKYIYFDGTDLSMRLVSFYVSSIETNVSGVLNISSIGEVDALTNPVSISTGGDTSTYAYINHETELRLSINESSQAILNATGFGIGITPSYKLHVKGSIMLDAGSTWLNVDASDAGTGEYAGIQIQSAGIHRGFILSRVGNNSGIYNTNGITMVADTGNLHFAARYTSDREIRFYVSSITSTDADVIINTSGVLLAKRGINSSSTITAPLFNNYDTQTRDKIRVWNSSYYTIGMKWGYRYGFLGGTGTNSDYAMSFQMNDANTRGFWWGDYSHTDLEGAMSLTTDGRLVVAKSISVGEGEGVNTPHSTTLYVGGSMTVSTNAAISGNLTVTGTTTATGRITANGDIHIPYRILALYWSFREDHSIVSKDASGNYADDIRINSLGAIYLNLDSNNNNNQGADFVIYRHGGSVSLTDKVFHINGENKNVEFYGNLYIPNIVYHSNDTNTYLQFHAEDSFRVVTGGSTRLEVVNSGVKIPSHLGVGINLNSSYRIYAGAGTAYGIRAHGSTMGGRFEDSNGTSRAYCAYGHYDFYGNLGSKNYLSGSLGIGVTDPTEKLDVNGNVRATQYKSRDGVFRLYTSSNDLYIRTDDNSKGNIYIGGRNTAGTYKTSIMIRNSKLVPDVRIYNDGTLVLKTYEDGITLPKDLFVQGLTTTQDLICRSISSSRGYKPTGVHVSETTRTRAVFWGIFKELIPDVGDQCAVWGTARVDGLSYAHGPSDVSFTFTYAKRITSGQIFIYGHAGGMTKPSWMIITNSSTHATHRANIAW